METSSSVSLIAVIIPITVVVFIISVGVVLLYQNFQKNLYRQRLDREAMKALYQQDLLRNSLSVQEAERKRIASDLHDELGATLSILRMHLVQAAGKPAADNQAPSPFGQLIELSNAALNSVRQISHQLMPPQLESFGLPSTLESVTNTINAGQAVRINLSISTHWPPELPWPISLGLYRVIMELLQNSLKHAAATSIWVTLDSEPGWLTGHYRDNGRGLPPDTPMKGAGLLNIEARVSAMDGAFSYGNADTGGFMASLKIPNH